MILKRGAVREACDFCYRRKLRCDRLQRLEANQDGCTQCKSRQISCSLDDSDDIRLRERTRASIRHTRPFAPRRHRLTTRVDGTSPYSPSATNTTSSSQRHGVDRTASAPTLSFPQSSSGGGLLPPNPASNTSIEPVSELPLELGYTDQIPAWDPIFDLSSSHISFLDDLFMGDLLDWPLSAPNPAMVTEGVLPAAHASEARSQQTVALSVSSRTVKIHQSKYCLLLNVAPDVIDAALHGYFSAAALHIPILLEDAFWEDFWAGRCAPTLVLAVLCRGLPFTNVENKWKLQQKLARDFRQELLKFAEAAHDDDRSFRLDVLEAFALMVGFDHGDADSRSALNLRLEKLFLTHDSLVLMVLDANFQDSDSPALNPSTGLSATRERRILLFWHIYSLDAFHCLESKRLSRIQDEQAAELDQVSCLPAEGYLDAILNLARLARKIVRDLCCTRARRSGVKGEHIESLFESLRRWRSETSPLFLRIEERCSAAEVSVSLRCQIHRACLTALEANCYMQIEDCVAEWGIEGETLQAEMWTLRIEYESLCSVQRIVDILRRPKRNGTDSRPLVDFSPDILRNICAGLCTWMCLRRMDLERRAEFETPLGKYIPKASRRYSNGLVGVAAHCSRSKVYAEVIRELRDAVASAVSHRDTETIVCRLDGLISNGHSETVRPRREVAPAL